MNQLAPTKPKDRFDVYRFFNGMSEEGKERLDQRRGQVPLVKTFLLEHVGEHGSSVQKSPGEIFRGLGARVNLLDPKFLSLTYDVLDDESNVPRSLTTGFIEQYDDRFFAYYTCENSKDAQRRVAYWLQSPYLDATWFSSPLLQAIWDKDVSRRGDNRFGKLTFRHESIFEMPEDFTDYESISESGGETDHDDSFVTNVEDSPDVERRNARFEMADRIGKIRTALDGLQKTYDPLHALYSLRLPSRTTHGSHDLYQSGRVTNRTDSFEDHRNTVRYLYRIYSSILSSTERNAWQDISSKDQISTGLKGLPLIIKFEEPLSQATFDRWVQLAFQKRNRFKLWGDPIRLGPSKVHVYGADRHLWQPINLEITSKGLTAILPRGTCGNTFHRLISNIQHYVSPKISAWIGSEPFKTLVGDWIPNLAEAETHEG
jgi:hypothetical protein